MQDLNNADLNHTKNFWVSTLQYWSYGARLFSTLNTKAVES